MSYTFLSDAQSIENLCEQMSDAERTEFNNFGHLHFDGAFKERVFIVYESGGSRREPVMSKVLARLKVVDFEGDEEDGFSCKLCNMDTLETHIVDHVPSKPFGLNFYMMLPDRMEVRWSLREHQRTGEVSRSLSFAVLIKTADRLDFHTKGNVYVATPNVFRATFPELGYVF